MYIDALTHLLYYDTFEASCDDSFRSVHLKQRSRFSSIFTQIVTTWNRRIMRETHIRKCKVNVTLGNQRSQMGALVNVCYISLEAIGLFETILHKLSRHVSRKIQVHICTVKYTFDKSMVRNVCNILCPLHLVHKHHLLH